MFKISVAVLKCIGLNVAGVKLKFDVLMYVEHNFNFLFVKITVMIKMLLGRN